MKKILWSVMALGLLLAAPLRLWAQDVKPVVLVSVASYDELLADLAYIGQLGGQPELANTVEGLLGFFTQNQGLAGLDKTKPWGAMVMHKDGDFPSVSFLPVTEVDKLLGALAAFIEGPEDVGDGVQEIKIKSNSMPLYLKSQNGWVFVARSADHLATLPADPLALLNGLDKQYDLAVQGNLQNVPEEYRQLAIATIADGLQKSLQPMEGEDDAAFQARKKLAEQQMEQLTTAINELDTLTIGWAIDRTNKKTYLDIGSTVVAGSKSADQLQALKGLKSNFGGFSHAKSMVGMILSTVSSPEDAEQGLATLEQLREQIQGEIKKSQEFPDDEARQAASELVNDALDLAADMTKSGKGDVGFGVAGEGPYTFLLGLHLGDGKKLPALVDKVVALAKREGQLVEFQKDADQHGDVSFHRLVIKEPAEEEAKKGLALVFGPGNLELVFGTSADRGFMALGPDGINHLKAAIDKSQEVAGQEVLPLDFSLALTPILKLAGQADDSNPVLPLVAGMLEQTGLDHVRIQYRPVAMGAIVRIEAEEGILQLIGTFASQAGAAAAGGGGGGNNNF